MLEAQYLDKVSFKFHKLKRKNWSKLSSCI